MSNPIIKLVNATTGEEIEREMNAEELAQYEADQAAQIARQEAEEQKAAEEAAAAEALATLKASARAKLVAGTPLTEEEAATLVI